MPEPAVPVTRFASSRDALPIAYATHGAGKTAIVLIHGWSCDKSYWVSQVGVLSRDFQVITLDLGGHGASGTGRTSWTINSFGEDVAAVVQAVDPENVVLVGHSRGGYVAISAALLLGGRVKGVVWVDTYRKLGSPRSAEEIQNVLRPFRTNFKATTDAYVRGMFGAGADEQLVPQVATNMAAAPPEIAVPALESSLTFGRDITKFLAEIQAPIFAINAEEPPNDVQSLQQHGVELLTMPAVGHFLMMEDPQSFNDLLRQVLCARLSLPK